MSGWLVLILKGAPLGLAAGSFARELPGDATDNAARERFEGSDFSMAPGAGRAR
ncbi:MAG: hypothetical protein R2729_11140 [Bryobacteraceae bacterium]